MPDRREEVLREEIRGTRYEIREERSQGILPARIAHSGDGFLLPVRQIRRRVAVMREGQISRQSCRVTGLPLPGA